MNINIKDEEKIKAALLNKVKNNNLSAILSKDFPNIKYNDKLNWRFLYRLDSKDMTLGDIARGVGYTVAYMSMVIHRKIKIHIFTAKKIARFLDCDSRDIFETCDIKSEREPVDTCESDLKNEN